MTKVLTDAKVAFCSVSRPDGHKHGKHLLGVFVDKKFKKELEKDFEALWLENKTKKAKKPTYSMDEWFSEDEKTKELIFWTTANASAERGIKFKQGKGCNFTEDDIKIIGAGSIIDLSFDIYYFNSPSYGEMVSRSIKAIALKELVPYSDDGGLDGEEILIEKPEKKAKNVKKVKDDVAEVKKKKKKD